MQKFRIKLVSVTATYRTGGPWDRPPEGPLVQSAAVANIKSQIKRNRQNERSRLRNKSVRSTLKTAAKKVGAAAADGDLEGAAEGSREAARALDKAASKGVIHKRTAARRKSRLARLAAGTGTEG
jgi:small subunit ribosomal protein S20